MSLRHTIIRDLVYEYQVNKDAVVFSKLLQRCDGLLFATIYKHIRRRRLQNIDARDLYHTAIVGLGRAALTSPQNETAEKFTARIVAYVRLELDNDYYDKHRPGPSHFVSIDFQEEQPYFDDVTTKIDFEMLLSTLRKAVSEGLLTEVELQCVIKKKMFDIGYLEIGKCLGMTRDGARKRILQLEKSLHQWLVRRGSVF